MSDTAPNFEEFISAEIAEIKRHRWIESEKAGCDLGECAAIDWVQKYSAAFREGWKERQRAANSETMQNEGLA